MSTHTFNRTLRFESLQQRLLMTANQADTSFDAVAVRVESALNQRTAQTADESGPALTSVVASNLTMTDEWLPNGPAVARSDVQKGIQLEDGNEFIVDTPSTGHLVTKDGVVTAYRDVEIVQDWNSHGCTQDGGCWSTLMLGPIVCGKDRLGAYRNNIVDHGGGNISFDMMIIYGVPFDDPADVSGDGFVTPRDLLILINDINAHGSRQLDRTGEDSASRTDVNGDGRFSPIDLLLVINALNQQQKSEGQRSPWPEVDEFPGQCDLAIPRVSETPSCLPGATYDSYLSTDVTKSVGTPQQLAQQDTDTCAATQAMVELFADSLPAIQVPRAITEHRDMEESPTTDDFWAQNIDEVFTQWNPAVGLGIGA